MHIFLLIIALLVMFLSIINLLRMTLFLVGSNLYDLKLHKWKRRETPFRYPRISIIIPAHNEEKGILKCISSVINSNYPANSLEVIVIDDNSTDSTHRKVIKYKNGNPKSNINIISQNRMGKAHALNNGIINHATGSLVMCLDADSYLSPDALKNAARHFQDKRVMALAANVKVAKSKGLLNLIQRLEYLVSYQMKKAQNFYSIEYIVGGIGSTFRKSFLKVIDFYDTNTVTEDIDITMKIISHGNKEVKIAYASDLVVYTQSVISLKGLINQRHRWKWGRYQAFLKNESLFFSTHRKFAKRLTWIYLPYALLCDVFYLLEPLVVFYILYLAIYFRDLFTLVSAFIVVTFYLSMNILSDETTSKTDKIKYLLVAPSMYLLFYVLSFVEYIALLRSLLKLHNLKASLLGRDQKWSPVKRASYS